MPANYEILLWQPELNGFHLKIKIFYKIKNPLFIICQTQRDNIILKLERQLRFYSFHVILPPLLDLAELEMAPSELGRRLYMEEEESDQNPLLLPGDFLSLSHA